jgi:hypothetical protein
MQINHVVRAGPHSSCVWVTWRGLPHLVCRSIPSTLWTLVRAIVVVMTLAGVSGCLHDRPKVNTLSEESVWIYGVTPGTVEGEYVLRFDTGWQQYQTLKKEAEGLLVKGMEVDAPDRLRVTERSSWVDTVEVTESAGKNQNSLSTAYVLHSKLSIQALPDEITTEFTDKVNVFFPAVPVIGQACGSKQTIPMISFKVEHFPPRAELGRRDIVKWAVLSAVSIFVFWLFARGKPKDGSTAQVVMWVVGLVAAVFVFSMVTSLWWMIRG